jgi:hypothetical protein
MGLVASWALQVEYPVEAKAEHSIRLGPARTKVLTARAAAEVPQAASASM